MKIGAATSVVDPDPVGPETIGTLQDTDLELAFLNQDPGFKSGFGQHKRTLYLKITFLNQYLYHTVPYVSCFLKKKVVPDSNPEPIITKKSDPDPIEIS